MKTQLQLLCNIKFNTHTQDEMYIEFYKIHLAYQAHEKHTQDKMHVAKNLVALIKKNTLSEI